MSTKTIITAALTGVLTTREQSPAIPYTPAEIAEEARRSVAAIAGLAFDGEGGDDHAATSPRAFLRMRASARRRR